jgi:hypothetical protein
MTSSFQNLKQAIKQITFLLLLFLVILFGNACEFQLPPPAPDLFYKYNVLKVGSGPAYLLSSDFNLDGFPDLLSANGNDHTATLFIGNGDGTFRPARNLKVFPEPSYAATGDLNKDGFPDIVLNSKGANGLSILLGYGNGNFRPTKKLATGRVPLTAILDDFNNDSLLDIAVSLTFNKLEIYIGAGNGQFKKGNTYATGSRARSIVSGDFNKDNFKDIAIASNSSSSSSLRILDGHGDGSFSLSHRSAKGKSLIVLAKEDMDGDGWQDLVAASAQGDNLYLLKSIKNGKFAGPLAFSAGGGPAALTIGQFDNDNLNDVAVANGRSSSFSVIFRTPKGGFRHPPRDYIVEGGTPLAITSADFNKDGKTDIAVSSAAKDIVEIYLGRKYLPGSSSSKPTNN